jgi:hypothetical protein
MLREAHRSQFSPALEVAGSGVGERPSSPLRVHRIFSAMSALSPGFPPRADSRSFSYFFRKVPRPPHPVPRFVTTRDPPLLSERDGANQ